MDVRHVGMQIAASLAVCFGLGRAEAATLAPRVIFDSQRGENGSFDLWMMDVNGGSLQQVTNTSTVDERGARVSPDGRYIMARDQAVPGSMVMIDLLTGIQRNVLTNVANLNGTFDWSPDGQRVVVGVINVGSFENRSVDLWTYQLDLATGNGLHAVRLTNASGTAYDQAASPQWSPDGSTVLFNGSPIGTPHRVWAVDAFGNQQVTLGLDTGAGNDQGPSWNLDGSKIAWQNDQLLDLFMANPDGTNITRLTTGLQAAATPAFISSSALVFSSSAGSALGEIWRVNVDGTGLTQLTFDNARQGSVDFGLAIVDPVPEPGTIALTALGLAGFMLRQRRSRKA